MADAVTVVYECQTCWARATTPDAIEHLLRYIEHPGITEVRRLEFPVVLAPTGGLFGRWT